MPSRRLGRSLGINNIIPKNCSYSCVYCQLGRTLDVQADRREFYQPSWVAADVLDRIREVERGGETIDYVTFVPDGEPTLDKNLGEEIRLVRESGIRVAVITNSSLIWREDVQEDLMDADWVSLKVDTVREETWKSINRPHDSLDLEQILAGAREFSRKFGGILATETMLVSGVNTSLEESGSTSRFLKDIDPAVAYISIPTRPPSEEWVEAPDEYAIASAHIIFRKILPRVELLVEFEGTDFTSTGNPIDDILAIASVHPLRRDALEGILARKGLEWGTVSSLLRDGKLAEVDYGGFSYYLRKFR